MTDAEITEKLAKFMDYEIIDCECDGVCVEKTENVTHHEWNPLDDISDAWEVEEHGIKDKGLEVRYCTELRKITGHGDFKYIHATPRERCMAVLKIMEEE